jgi:phosphoribosylformylglycinamidine synthase subunit PurQ / glutaminase
METGTDAVLLTFPGTNCDGETARALQRVGFATRRVTAAELSPDALHGAGLVVLPGGFSYGDYVLAGRLAQLRIEAALGDSLQQFRDAGGYLLGICNGFQILCKLGLLQRASLVAHADGRFLCCWVALQNRAPAHPFLRGLPAQFALPLACAEGCLVAPEGAAQRYVDQGLAPLTYAQPVNGSEGNIAALTDATGRVFGMMPHPERFMERQQHPDPDWGDGQDAGWGTLFFEAVYDAVTSEAT